MRMRLAGVLALVSASIACCLSAALAQGANLDALTLEQAEALLGSRNRDIRLARHAVDAAQANVAAAAARPNPSLSLGISSINPQAGIGAGPLRDKTVDSSMRLDQLVERGGKRELRMGTAQRLAWASTDDYSETQRTQRLALRAAYYDLLSAQDKAAVASENAGLFQRSLDAALLRLRAGDISESDVSRIRVDMLRAANDLRSALAERSRAQVVLAYLVGAETEAARLRAADPWPAAAAVEAVDPDDEALEHRPDVRAARTRLEAAQSARALARSLRTRDITIGASYDRYPVGTGANQFGTGSSYGLFVSMPLFVRYEFEGEIRRAEADYNAARDVLEKVRAQARSDIRRAASDLEAALERLRRYDSLLLVEARRSAESAEFAYRNGAIGVMDLLDARRTLRAIQLDAVSARAEYAKARSAYDMGRGGPSGTVR